MQNNQIVVFGHHQILFQIIRSLRIRHRFCWQRMLRQISTGTAMGDDYFFVAVRRHCTASHDYSAHHDRHAKVFQRQFHAISLRCVFAVIVHGDVFRQSSQQSTR
ncbi:hypothetical protein HmCmsJML295_00303 [Escherichia coli]|nr:hypothetical protein HmCmsJML295_00303 [Escherichia coli]